MSSDPRFRELVSYFAATVGVERSEELLTNAAREAGIVLGTLDDDAVRAILEVLERSPGIVGVTARFASRRRARRAPTPMLRMVDARPSLPRVGAKEEARERETVQRHEIEDVLAAAMDELTAHRVVQQYWEAAGIPGSRCSPTRALALLDAMASSEGVVGVAATFAKARWHMRRK